MLPTSYTYLHKDPETQEVRYVGAGSKGRAWACGWRGGDKERRGNRSEEHQDWLNTLFDKGYTLADIVEINEKSLTREQSFEIERTLITKYGYDRLFNLPHNWAAIITPKQINHAKVLRHEGMSYSKIGGAIGCSTMTAWRALTGKTEAYV